MTDDVAAALDEYAEYLDIDGEGGRSNAYSRAANKLRRVPYIPPDPASINGVGDSIRDTIIEYQQTGKIEQLESLKEEYSYYEEFRFIDGVGPKTARRLGVYGITSRQDLEQAIESGDILDVHGIGQKRAENILDALQNC